jgi:low temperature requirement protein LtrA
MKVLILKFSKEINNGLLVIIILASVFILLKLIQNKKKEESKSNILYAIISVLITIFLFYNFFKNYL